MLGVSIYNTQTQQFDFKPGPIFANIVLADEINRTTPRTQSALLEAMSEEQVSVESQTRQLTRPFMVVATQNPFEFEGTYYLPENQLDRFLLRIALGYPERKVELKSWPPTARGSRWTSSGPSINSEKLHRCSNAPRRGVDDSINEYILDMVSHAEPRRTGPRREHPRSNHSLPGRPGYALLHNRGYVVPDNVKSLAVPVLAYRIVCRSMLREGQRARAVQIVEQILNQVAVPS